MPQDESMSLDAWRVTRNKSRREDDLMIDKLCDTLLQLQDRVTELEAIIKNWENHENSPI